MKTKRNPARSEVRICNLGLFARDLINAALEIQRCQEMLREIAQVDPQRFSTAKHKARELFNEIWSMAGEEILSRPILME